MIVPVMAISNLVLTRQIYSEETNGAHPHNRDRVPLSKCLKARQMCVDDDDENVISKKPALLTAQDTQQCTEHPTQIRGCVLGPRTQ